MSKNLHFIDPENGEEYDATRLPSSTLTNVTAGEYRVAIEITQFGMWGSKSYIIIRHKPTGYCFYYVLTNFDDILKGSS